MGWNVQRNPLRKATCGCRTFSRATDRLSGHMALLLLLLFAMSCGSSLIAQDRPLPEEVEWTWEVRPPHADLKLPNVLLLGDSISRNYFPEVTKELAGIANVYLMASSTCVGDPRLPGQIDEFAELEGVHLRVVHFNNGMHGWQFTEAQYKDAFPSFVQSTHALLDKGGALIWASTTPVRPGVAGGASNARIDERNAIALSIVKPGGIVVDDQHALMMQHSDLHEDGVHFNAEGARLQGVQAASLIRSAIAGGH